MSEELFVFSYDDDNDALNTLATYYQITTEKIHSNMEFLQEKYEEFKVTNNANIFLYVIRELLDAAPLKSDNDKFKIYFYHRTGSDCTKEWFAKGLLNSREGISSFVSNVERVYPDLNISTYEDAMLGHDLPKHQFEVAGPFAFLRKIDAIENTFQRSFLNLPEIFFDVAHNDDIYEILLGLLHPTLVKFWVHIDSDYFESYILDYWCSLLGNYEKGFDVGQGKNIPYENIVEIIKLPKYIDTDSLVHEI
ncbi:hypothetical protein MID07_01005 [Acinetobacter seifertii]|uniref:hypothetical protein n=1 Tax=Acinetobacter seifertii TaxID=1530123 RepID=UPI001F028D88|nr:hypothetical protein [Acinetobacter seifertii]MCG8283204.1 hypothetical protein [Acinetobacter seifertii]